MYFGCRDDAGGKMNHETVRGDTFGYAERTWRA